MHVSIRYGSSPPVPQHWGEMGRIGVLFELRHADTRLVSLNQGVTKLKLQNWISNELGGYKTHSTGDLMEHIYICMYISICMYSFMINNIITSVFECVHNWEYLIYCHFHRKFAISHWILGYPVFGQTCLDFQMCSYIWNDQLPYPPLFHCSNCSGSSSSSSPSCSWSCSCSSSFSSSSCCCCAGCCDCCGCDIPLLLPVLVFNHMNVSSGAEAVHFVATRFPESATTILLRSRKWNVYIYIIIYI